ncbi:MAG: DUF3604 domain-containing protein [Deltaproteobacteria bacterium]|nr:DUF3604 domain-containing protein [Deltaproteobacteria bacterium]
MRVAVTVIAVLALVVLLVLAAARGHLGRHEGPGRIAGEARPAESVARRVSDVAEAAGAVGAEASRQILFGDLHVHTTFSSDAFLFSLPMLGNASGAYPPADACDFARFCSALDFFSINDHAESLSPDHWQETLGSIRQCNDLAGDPANPDLVAYLGWEWTQKSPDPQQHYGHKNVVLRDLEDERIPTRPIASTFGLSGASLRPLQAVGLPLVAGRRGLDQIRYRAELGDVERCPAGVPVRSLPTDCIEVAETPAELFAKLNEWDHAALVIPHGSAWGWTAPPGADWALQLSRGQDDPRQNLVEVYSGHGNSEEYRPWREAETTPEGSLRCPEPSADYLPSCWRAGEIIRTRCLEAGESEEECELRAVEARSNHIAAGASGAFTVPGAQAEEWLEAGQCPDCFLPSFDYRPAMSVQSMLARSDFDEEGAPYRQRMGFIGSSDIHSARAGTGYKEFARHGAMTDVRGPEEPIPGTPIGQRDVEPQPRSVPPGDLGPGFAARDLERAVSFLYTGGLVAVHASGRDRQSVWESLARREVYGTSGGRTLLWFDVLNAPVGLRPMGSEVAMTRAPRFRARAVGAFEQLPGCPDYSVRGLPAERLERLCRGECQNPSAERKRITRIEVVRIRPQTQPDEPIDELIEDPWLVHECPDDPSGCSFEFEDPDFRAAQRETLYYVRALEEPSPAVNGANLRCERDEQGRCVQPRPCFADDRTPRSDDCLADVAERAWSSPIWVSWGDDAG